MEKNRLVLILTLVCLLGLAGCGIASAATYDHDLSGANLIINVTGNDKMTINGQSFSISGTTIAVSGSSETSNLIYVDGRNYSSAKTVNIVLNGVAINPENRNAKTGYTYGYNSISIINKAKVNLEVKDGTVNSLKAVDSYAAIRAVEGTNLTINGTGTLNIEGGSYSAGIGGNADMNRKGGESTGIIIINDSIINILAAEYGVGIGGGAGQDGTSSVT